MIGICLDCFVEKGLTVTTTTDLCNANNLQNGGIYYYFDTKEEMVLACVEEAISRIEQGAFSIAFEDIKDIANMMDHLGTLADELSPVMRFLVSVCVSQEYGNKVKPYLVQLAGRYPYYTKKIAEILGCTAAAVPAADRGGEKRTDAACEKEGMIQITTSNKTDESRETL